jgi:diguanylate cyclase (GGDEF)-like protein
VAGGITLGLGPRDDPTDRDGDIFQDWLTGLPNRAAFRRRLRRVLDEAARGGPSVSVVVLGIDRFVALRRELGARVGARVLVHVAEHLLDRVPPPHEAASLGDGEFAVLVTGDVGDVVSTSIAVDVLRALQAPMVVSGQPVRIRARAGITSTRPGQGVDEVLRNAYTALALTRRD